MVAESLQLRSIRTPPLQVLSALVRQQAKSVGCGCAAKLYVKCMNISHCNLGFLWSCRQCSENNVCQLMINGTAEYDGKTASS